MTLRKGERESGRGEREKETGGEREDEDTQEKRRYR